MNPQSSNYWIWIYLMASVGALLASLFVYQFVFRYPIWTLHAFAVTPDKVIGKPIMLYWSPEASRIGCPVQ